ncbi:MAG: PKD domain-containing protein [Bacteroidota bacterium]|nr:PKD domain-containing protein [Bacteroidota bacterium]
MKPHDLVPLRRVALLLGMAVLTTTWVQAQDLHYRTEGTVFIKPKVGLSSYLGDNEKSPLNFDGDAFSVAFPWHLALEGGYQVSVPFSVSLAVAIGEYSIITQFPNQGRMDEDVAEDPSVRTSVQAIGRYIWAEPTTRAAPYVNFGLGASFGTVTQNSPPNYSETESGVGFGPVLGLGLDIAMNPKTSFFVEMNTGLHFGDSALDGDDSNGMGGMDLLTGLGLGLKFNTTAAITPPFIHGVSCPTGNVVTGSEASFEAMTNSDVATAPVEMRWDYGDDNTGMGASTVHTFTSDGTRTVTFSMMNEGGMVSESCDVTVVAPAGIVTASADRMMVSICDDDPSVTFSANTRGTSPLSYSWDFGDGNTSTDAAPSHTYESPGSYTATVTVTNMAGSDTQSMTIEVNETGCFNCDISEMNSIFFERNDSSIMEESMTHLNENLEILQNCEFNVRIEGHASRDERNASQLSEARARVVMQFYLDNGIDEARMSMLGMGASGQTTKKSGNEQFRRVDTIPLN